MKAIIDAAYNAIKRRHNNIPQETLPLVVAETAPTGRAKTGAKQRGPRSIRFAKCSHCLCRQANRRHPGGRWVRGLPRPQQGPQQRHAPAVLRLRKGGPQ